MNLTVNGKPASKSMAVKGTRVFHDHSMRLTSISKELSGSDLFHLSWYDDSKTSISVYCEKNCVLIVVVWKLRGRRNGLISQLQGEGWLLKDDLQISWELDGTKEHGETKGILSKTIPANYVYSFNKPENDLPFSIFVVQGGF